MNIATDLLGQGDTIMAKIAAELFIYGSLLELQPQDEELQRRTKWWICVERAQS